MSCDFLALAMPSIQSLQPYQPGKPIDELARKQGLVAGEIIKLASNENPLGAPQSALAAMQKVLPEISRYPDANGFYLKQALATKYDIDVKQITLGNGSNDVLVLLAECYLTAGLSAIHSEYAFFIYSLAIKATGAEGLVVPALNKAHNLNAMVEAIEANTRMIFLANPNNPTGTCFSESALIAFLQQVPDTVLVVLDEAYVEYRDEPERSNSITLIKQFPNLVITRTFSKAYGLAGCRVGYSVSHPDVAGILNRLRQPFNVNVLAQEAALAVLSDEDYLDRTRAINNQGMKQLHSGLTQLGLECIPSSGNFICVNMKQNAQTIYQRMLSRGVIVRPIANYNLPEHLRISIGTPNENQRCLDVMKAIL
ncbi:MAG: histidinol-phosphate transaminase [Endozoicomonas sp. (ex Botrylloides leachii)]|nr:histidinol-phosphate transaminase [Endozoicomonas sp. (ex Botrylloides leachii)]